MTREEAIVLIPEVRSDIMWVALGSTSLILLPVDQLWFHVSHVDFGAYRAFYSDITRVTTSPPLYLCSVSTTVGSDPELFFVKDGEVVPSNLVVPAEGSNRVIRDGFQGELNPLGNSCRQTAGSNLAFAFLEAVRLARAVGAEVSMRVGHVIGDDAWSKTPLMMRRFGCNPTLNSSETNPKRVTGLRERFRAAGGHIHVGYTKTKLMSDINKIVEVMNIVVGNTCVLVDRDPDNARRRINYGRAGEYREKPYGLEYRVLSNFWLKSYTLWSMASILVRNSLAIHNAGLSDELISRFDIKKVRQAINENDFELARENFLILSDFLKEHNAFGNGLSAGRVDKFYRWATSVDPLSRWSTLEQTIDSWEGKTQSNGTGFESFIDSMN